MLQMGCAYSIFLGRGAIVVGELLEMAYTGISNLHNPFHHEATFCVCMTLASYTNNDRVQHIL